MKARPKKTAVILVCISVLYIGSYIYLSGHGRYEPFVFGTNGVKGDAWTPEGFYQKCKVKDGKVISIGKWNRWLGYFYLPLLGLDWNLWHTNSRTDQTKYPVDVDENKLFEPKSSN